MNQSYDWDRAPFNDTVFLHVQMPFRRSVYLLSNPFRTSNFSYSNVILRDHDVIVFFINLLAYSLCIHLIGCFFVFWLPLFFFLVILFFGRRFPLVSFECSAHLEVSLSLSLPHFKGSTTSLLVSSFLRSCSPSISNQWRVRDPLTQRRRKKKKKNKRKRIFSRSTHESVLRSSFLYTHIQSHIFIYC